MVILTLERNNQSFLQPINIEETIRMYLEVKNNLKESGFSYKKVEGFSGKRHMLIGNANAKPKRESHKKKVAVIGSGITGCMLSYMLAKKGIEVDLFEQSETICSAASSHELLITYPRLSAHDTAYGRFNLQSYIYATNFYNDLNSDAWKRTGVLLLNHHTETKKRQASLLEKRSDGKIYQFLNIDEVAEKSGLDGIELCATSHLLDQFWTPLVNKRTDEYGGSIDNRLRFTFEILEAIREAVGAELLLGIRMIANEDQIGGLSTEESREIAQKLAESELLDFMNIASSSLATEAGLSKAIPPSGTPLAPYLPLAASIKETVDIPILHATRITDVSSARYAIESASVDLIGMTRAHMADPHIVKKIKEGKEERIRTCVGASLCIT